MRVENPIEGEEEILRLSSNGLINGSRYGALLALTCFVLVLGSWPAVAADQSAEDIYNHKCAVCHGKDGLGNTVKGKKAHVKDVHTNMKDSEDAMIKIVVDGKGEDMDSYKKEFTPQQIKDLVDYYRSLGQK
jgi:mono/diheme cytochrome c family protein